MSDHRRSYIDRDLIYLFSFDANLEVGREEIGLVPGGARVNVFSKPKDSRVYQVGGERVLEDVGPVTGEIIWGGDWPLLRQDIDAGSVDVRTLIHTDDDAYIYGRWNGAFPTGPGGFRRLISERAKLGTEDVPHEASIVIDPVFDTSAPQYKWLMDYQCVGFGRAYIVKSLIRRSSVDIFAMD